MADASQTRKEAVAQRLERKNAISFLQSFFLCGYTAKEKSVIGILVSINSALDFSSCLPFIHFFFVTKAAKKKFTKRNGECAQAARLCYAQSARF